MSWWWPFNRKTKEHSVENGGAAQYARNQAEQNLRNMYRKAGELDQTLRESRELRDVFGEQIKQSWRRAT